LLVLSVTHRGWMIGWLSRFFVECVVFLFI
jgi:hypothetical protein